METVARDIFKDERVFAFPRANHNVKRLFIGKFYNQFVTKC